MLAMGWTDQSIGEIDEGAAQRLEEGRRTAEQIRATTQQVYRGKEFAEEGERWDTSGQWPNGPRNAIGATPGGTGELPLQAHQARPILASVR